MKQIRKTFGTLRRLPQVIRKRATIEGELASHAIEPGCVLNIGSSTTSFGRRSVNLDRTRFGGVSVQADAHSLPFAPGSFDLCVLSAVLQYCRSPATVVAEAHRVLRPGGHIAIDAPFVQAYCPELNAPDLWRFTDYGLRALCADRFTILSCNVSIGSISAMTHFAQRMAARPRHTIVRHATQLAASLLVWPLAWVQYTHTETAGAFVLIGRK